MMCIQIKPNTSLSALILNLGAQQCSKKKKLDQCEVKFEEQSRKKVRV